MTDTVSALPIDSAGELAQSLPGFDATPVISAGEQRLADLLSMPTRHLLDQFRQQVPLDGISKTPASSNSPIAGMPANPGGAISPVGPAALISPVLNALSTLGTGQFAGMDPTSVLGGIGSSLAATSGPVQQALSAVQQGWVGDSSAAAAARTSAALANAAEVATQASGLQNSLSAAAADVAQAQAHLIAIVNEFFATVAAIGINIIFPWGWAAVLAAAAHAVAQAAQVVTETQASLAAQATAVSAIGKPVAVAAAPQLGTSMASPLSSILGASAGSTASPASAMSTLSPLMYLASGAISPAMSAASAAGNAGGATGTATGTLADATAQDPKAAGAPGGKSGGHAGPVLPGEGGASAGTQLARATPPATPAVAAAPETAPTAPSAAIRPASATMPMTGGGAMGGPLAGAGHANGIGGAHSAASYLHTSDQGGKVVKDRSTVAPPVLGEVDPNETPDIELRI